MNGNLLKAKITERGLTQSQVANMIGISGNSLSRKIRGLRDFRLREVQQLCDCLNIDNPGEIFFNHNIPKMQQN